MKEINKYLMKSDWMFARGEVGWKMFRWDSQGKFNQGMKCQDLIHTKNFTCSSLFLEIRIKYFLILLYCTSFVVVVVLFHFLFFNLEFKGLLLGTAAVPENIF